MKPTSPNKRLSVPSSSPRLSVAAAEHSRQTSNPALIDRRESPTKRRRSPSPASSTALPAPSIPNVRTIGDALDEIAKALHQGSFRRVQAVMQEAADGRRLEAVLRAPADGSKDAPYAALVDQSLKHLDGADTQRLVRKFGAELLNATIEHCDTKRFSRCCGDLQTILPRLATKDSAWLARAAAKEPQFLSVLLSHLPTKHWSELLTANNGEAMALLWRSAVREAGAGPAHAEHAQRREGAFGALTQIFTHVPVQAVNALHHGILIQRHLRPALRNFATQMRALEQVLIQRGGTAPWGNV